MICMIPKVNLGVGEMGKITLCRGYIFVKLALFDFCFARGHIRFLEF